MKPQVFPATPAYIYVPTIHNMVRRCYLLYSSPSEAKVVSHGCMWEMNVQEEWYLTEEDCRSAIAFYTGLQESEIPLYQSSTVSTHSQEEEEAHV